METNTSGHTPRSHLLIDSVAPSDTGKYSCHPANAKDVSVTVHIQDGKSIVMSNTHWNHFSVVSGLNICNLH